MANQITGNSTDSPDLLNVLLALKSNVMRDLYVGEICKVISIEEDTYMVVPINNDKQKLACKSLKGLKINLNDYVMVLFTNTDYRLNFEKMKKDLPVQNLLNQVNLHSSNYGIIIGSFSQNQGGGIVEIPLANEITIGGIKAQNRDLETNEVKIDPSTGKLYASSVGEKGDKGDVGPQGPIGPEGPQGERGLQGEQGIQGLRGEKGDKGDTGEQGPQGLQGIPGETGAQGDKGDAATIQVGTVTTLPADSSATVTNVGTSSNAIFNFGIPQGQKGEAGDFDTELSSTSENGVQNKVITNAINGLMPKSGGTFTGNVTGQYLTGTWLQSTAATDIGAVVKNLWVESNGWLYKQTPTEFINANGIAKTTDIPDTTNFVQTTGNQEITGTKTFKEIRLSGTNKTIALKLESDILRLMSYVSGTTTQEFIATTFGNNATSSGTSSGYMILGSQGSTTNRIMICWGTVTPSASGTAITFPFPYANANYVVGATNESVKSNQIRAMAATNYKTTGFTAYGQYSQSGSGYTGGDCTFRWVSIGAIQEI